MGTSRKFLGITYIRAHLLTFAVYLVCFTAGYLINSQAMMDIVLNLALQISLFGIFFGLGIVVLAAVSVVGALMSGKNNSYLFFYRCGWLVSLMLNAFPVALGAFAIANPLNHLPLDKWHLLAIATLLAALNLLLIDKSYPK